MTTVVHIIAALHTVVYCGIIWSSWRNYHVLRSASWMYVAVGFFLLLVYRAVRLAILLQTDSQGLDEMDMRGTLLAFAGGAILMAAFWKISKENKDMARRLEAIPIGLRAGAQTTDYWLNAFRKIVKEENDLQTGKINNMK